MNESNATVPDPPPRPFQYLTIGELDLAIGTLYLLFGLFGICSNGQVLIQFWRARSTVKVHPFTLCAIVLAANDLVLCMLGVSPYAILILAKRPQQDSFPEFICKISGFVDHFCDRFAWFDITSIMVFRCVITVFTLKFRRITYHPFIYILSFLALLQGIICLLPFCGVDFIKLKYHYSPNFGECSYGVDAKVAPGMMVLIDVLWWGPILVCVLSCIVFFIFMRIHAKSVTSVRDSDKSGDAKRKTALLTIFFIICYLPKALLIFFDFLTMTGRLITWPWVYKVVGGEEKALKLYVYFNMMCRFVIPAGRAAFTPTVLNLRTYIKACDKRRKAPALLSPRNTMVSRMSAIWSKFPKVETPKLLRRSNSDVELEKLN